MGKHIAYTVWVHKSDSVTIMKVVPELVKDGGCSPCSLDALS